MFGRQSASARRRCCKASLTKVVFFVANRCGRSPAPMVRHEGGHWEIRSNKGTKIMGSLGIPGKALLSAALLVVVVPAPAWGQQIHRNAFESPKTSWVKGGFDAPFDEIIHVTTSQVWHDGQRSEYISLLAKPGNFIYYQYPTPRAAGRGIERPALAQGQSPRCSTSRPHRVAERTRSQQPRQSLDDVYSGRCLSQRRPLAATRIGPRRRTRQAATATHAGPTQALRQFHRRLHRRPGAQRLRRPRTDGSLDR